jgi:hypothetical protein
MDEEVKKIFYREFGKENIYVSWENLIDFFYYYKYNLFIR